MDACEFSKILGNVNEAREKAAKLRDDMKVLNVHEVVAEPEIVYKQADEIEKALARALSELRRAAEEGIKRVAGESNENK